ncbi:MAG: Bacterial regulatory protein arsR family, partial [Actinomycetota bacterium]
MTTAALLTALLDPDRLAVAGALAIRPMSSTELAQVTGRDRRTVLVALGDLRSTGIVGLEDDEYTLDVAALRMAARDAADVADPMD